MNTASEYTRQAALVEILNARFAAVVSEWFIYKGATTWRGQPLLPSKIYAEVLVEPPVVRLEVLL